VKIALVDALAASGRSRDRGDWLFRREGVPFGRPFIGSRRGRALGREVLSSAGRCYSGFGLIRRTSAARLSAKPSRIWRSTLNRAGARESAPAAWCGGRDCGARADGALRSPSRESGEHADAPSAGRADGAAEWIAGWRRLPRIAGLVATVVRFACSRARRTWFQIGGVDLMCAMPNEATRTAAWGVAGIGCGYLFQEELPALSSAIRTSLPVPMDAHCRSAADAVREAGYPVHRMTSGAGRRDDSGALVPAAMLFLRSPAVSVTIR